MKKLFIYITFALTAVVGCVDNDLPYPVVVPNVTTVMVDRADDVKIDYNTRTVTIYLPETEDIRNVTINSIKFDKDIATTDLQFPKVYDLSSPIKFTIHTYDDYEWTIVGVRNVTRYFTVLGQVGSSVIDEYNHRVMAKVGMDTSIDDITVTSLKLGPEGKTTYSMTMDQMKDFTHGLSVDVTAFGVTQTWNLYVDQTDISVEIQNINPWARMAYVTSLGIAGNENGFQYREKGSQQWIDVPQEDITSDGGSFVAQIKGLKEETEYEVVAICGTDRSPAKTFVTESATPLPNASFEHTSLVKGTSYYKFYDPDCGVADGSYMFWGSGNGEGPEGVDGSANMGIIITYVDQDEKVDGRQSVRAQTSQLAGILAAGNLFTGQFAGLVGTSGGKVNFGRPWTARPTALKLYCKYQTGTMDIINGMPPGVSLSKSDYDRAEIKFAIGNWEYRKYGGTPASPVHVDTTNPETFVDFSTDASTIAHGNLIIHQDGYVLNGSDKIAEDTDQWVEYTIPLIYHDMKTTPTHIVISCASSRYGDYFTGCSKSKLWLDKLELVY
jgi:hypothetical protein